MQDLIACGGVGHELGDVVGDDLPRDTPAVDAPAAALGLGHSREPRPVAVDLFLVAAGDDHGDSGREGEIVEGPRVRGCHPGAAQGKVGEHDRTRIQRSAFLVTVQSTAAGVIKQGDPSVGGLLGMSVISTAEHEGWDNKGARIAVRVGEHELPGHAETVTNPSVARGEGVLTQLHEYAAGAEPLIELIKVVSGLFLSAE